MKKENKLNLFEVFSLNWIILAFFSLILAWIGLFQLSFLILGIALLIFSNYWLLKKRWIVFEKSSKIDYLVFLVIAVWGIFITSFATPTIFGGRDEGSFSNAAILLAQNGSLIHSDNLTKNLHSLYGTGKALNFPGFNYTEAGAIKSQFLPAYISYLAIFYSFFQLAGLKLANILPLVTFLGSFYLITKRFTNRKTAIFATTIFATSLPLFILLQLTLTEIFFGSLIWLSAYLLIKYLKNKTRFYYWLIFLPLMPAVFTRIETMAIVFMLFVILLIRDFKHLKKPSFQLPFVLIIILFALALSNYTSFFTSAAKGLLGNLLSFAQNQSFGTEPSGAFNLISLLPNDWHNFYLLKVFFTYNLLFFLIIGIFALAYLIKKRKWHFLTPLFLFLPTLIYLFNANISLDHPWMLRRFVFTITPLLVLYSFLLLHRLFQQSQLSYSFLAAFLLLINLQQLFPFALTGQNQGLFGVLEKAKAQFSADDLVLVSQKAGGSAWLLPAEPLRNLHHIGAVYFFRPSDLESLRQIPHQNIYLLTSNLPAIRLCVNQAIHILFLRLYEEIHL